MRLESNESDKHHAEMRLRSPLLNRVNQQAESRFSATRQADPLRSAFTSFQFSRRGILALSAFVLLATAVGIGPQFVRKNHDRGTARKATSASVRVPLKSAQATAGDEREIDRLFQLSDSSQLVQIYSLSPEELRAKLQAALPKRAVSAEEPKTEVAAHSGASVVSTAEPESLKSAPSVTIASPKVVDATVMSAKSAKDIPVKPTASVAKEPSEAEGTVSTSAWLEPSAGQAATTGSATLPGSKLVSKKEHTTEADVGSEVSSADEPAKTKLASVPKPAAKAAISDMAEYNRLLASYFSKRQEASKSSASEANIEQPPTYDEWLNSKKQIF